MTAVVIILVIAAIVAYRSLIVVPANQRFVILRLGRVHSVAGPGLVMVMPFIDAIGARYSLDAQTAGVQHRGREIVVHYRVLDPQKAYVSVSDVNATLQQATRTAIDSMSGTGIDVFARKAIAEKIDGIVKDFGLKVTEVDVK